MANIKALVDQLTPQVRTENDFGYPSMTKIGQIFTANWKVKLALAGKLYRGSVGTVSGDGAVTRVTGGGAGTTMDLDEPEMIIGVPAGYFLIPIELHVSAVLDQDANAELGEIMFTADRTQCVAAGSGTALSMYNQLDGIGDAFPGVAGHTVTSAVTNPANEEIIALETVSSSEFVANGSATNLTNGVITKLQLDWKADYPDLIAGPCSVCVYWGGTAAVTALATIVVGVVPASWFPVT